MKTAMPSETKRPPVWRLVEEGDHVTLPVEGGYVGAKAAERGVEFAPEGGSGMFIPESMLGQVFEALHPRRKRGGFTAPTGPAEPQPATFTGELTCVTCGGPRPPFSISKCPACAGQSIDEIVAARAQAEEISAAKADAIQIIGHGRGL